jgi:hypothetical protein
VNTQLPPVALIVLKITPRNGPRRKHSLYCCRGVFTLSFHSKSRGAYHIENAVLLLRTVVSQYSGTLRFAERWADSRYGGGINEQTATWTVILQFYIVEIISTWWVEVGRHFKYSLQAVRPQYWSSSPCGLSNMSALAFTSRLRFTLFPQSVWVLSFTHVWEGERPHTHLFSLRVYALVASRTTAWKGYLNCPRNTIIKVKEYKI